MGNVIVVPNPKPMSKTDKHFGKNKKRNLSNNCRNVSEIGRNLSNNCRIVSEIRLNLSSIVDIGRIFSNNIDKMSKLQQTIDEHLVPRHWFR